MIISKLTGGLGNQLFQYAAAKALALHHNTVLKIDISHYNDSSARKFDLPTFDFNVEIAQQEEIERYINISFARKVYQRLLLPPYKRRPFKEPYFHYYKDFFKAPANCYLKGNWQSEKYFKPIENLVRQEYQLLPKYVKHLQPVADQMQAEQSISVHIRRGDYLNPEALKHHGVLSPEYYNKAISHITARYNSSKIYFFSDDIGWVKENIKTDVAHEFITGTTTKSNLEDFYLMQNCKHNIIANSSFSWWCAWLNSNKEKIVIAPNNWYNEANYSTKDLIPERWVLL